MFKKTGHIHIPVMLKESMDFINVRPKMAYVDGTVGNGGFAQEILRRSSPDGFLIGIDNDQMAVNDVREKLEADFNKNRFKIFYSNFSEIDLIVKEAGFDKIDGIVLDLGISSIQLESERGFSFNDNGPLDMRIDLGQPFRAYDIVNFYNEKDIADILWNYGDERFSRKIARKIVEYRKNKLIETSMELSMIVKRAVFRSSSKTKIDPATRTFLALRIFVNDEYNSLKQFLIKLSSILNIGAVACIISFHSGEDRIVKHFFKGNEDFNIITKKPLSPSLEEIRLNPRSRSAKLRAVCLK
jgi:16S rRNA (cytosine1402-N4)-methyltransferase